MQIACGLENSSATLRCSCFELLVLKADMASWLAGRGLLKEYSIPVGRGKNKDVNKGIM